MIISDTISSEPDYREFAILGISAEAKDCVKSNIINNRYRNVKKRT